MTSDNALYRAQYRSLLAATQGVEVDVIPLYRQVPAGLKFEMPVLFRVRVGAVPIQRQPVHICFVLDRSGSMTGDPLNNCKRAIKQAMYQLNSDDRVSLVVYDDTVDVIFSAVSPTDPSLPDKIDAVRERGWTNISAALEAAVDLLEKSSVAGGNEMKIAFLFSDGEANRGLTHVNEMGPVLTTAVSQKGVRFSTFGIGLQYNEVMLRSIARGGEGNYFFISETEAIASTVEKGVGGFTNVIGTLANFRVSGTNGSTLTSLQSDKTLETLTKGKTLPSLRCMGIYQFLAMVEVNSGATPDGKLSPVQYEMTFQPVKGAEPWARLSGSLVVDLADPTAVLTKSPEVVNYMTIGECADINHKVDAAMKNYNREEAIQLKQQIVAKCEELVESDATGIIGALLEREKTLLNELLRKGISSKTAKMHEAASAVGYSCTSTAPKQAWENHKPHEMGDDQDMGFSLFD